MMKSTDQHNVNHMLAALALEMTPKGPSRHHETDTLFVGGPAPNDDDQRALGQFGLSKNYKLIHASFDDAEMETGTDADERRAIKTTIDFLGTLILDGTLDTWKRALGGGVPEPIPSTHWEIDDFLPRFATSTYAASDWQRPEATPTHWIFVDAESFEAFMEDWHSSPPPSFDALDEWAPPGAPDPSDSIPAPSTGNASKQGEELPSPGSPTPTSMPADPLDASLPSGGTAPPVLLRLPKVMALTGLSRSTLYQWMDQGRFPASISLGARYTVWRQDEVVAWLHHTASPETRE